MCLHTFILNLLFFHMFHICICVKLQNVYNYCCINVTTVVIQMTFDLYRLSSSWRLGKLASVCHPAGLLEHYYAHYTHGHTRTHTHTHTHHLHHHHHCPGPRL